MLNILSIQNTIQTSSQHILTDEQIFVYWYEDSKRNTHLQFFTHSSLLRKSWAKHCNSVCILDHHKTWWSLAHVNWYEVKKNQAFLLKNSSSAFTARHNTMKCVLRKQANYSIIWKIYSWCAYNNFVFQMEEIEKAMSTCAEIFQRTFFPLCSQRFTNLVNVFTLRFFICTYYLFKA